MKMLKFLLFCILCFITGWLLAFVSPAWSKDTLVIEVPVTARIENLATANLFDAIDYCNARRMACPALRARLDELMHSLNELQPGAEPNAEIIIE